MFDASVLTFNRFMYRHNNPDMYKSYLRDFPKMYSLSMRLAKKYGAQKLLDIFADTLRQAWPSKWESQYALVQWRTATGKFMDEANPEDLNEINLRPNAGMSFMHLVYLLLTANC